jgi:tetratricopeptide (TPR) repeat protein
VAEAWSSFLDRSAAAARSPGERVVFDSHRLSAYIELGTPERAIPMLEQSQRDFPDDYNPPARLAIAYSAMKRWPEAITASDRALATCQGPRRLTLYRTRAEIHAGMGDTPGVKRTLDEAIAYARSLPPGQRSDSAIAALEKRRSALP